jgi:diguanylate cyclase (GGDEF)-like protein/PAS domain S-box-containing protein
MKTGKNTVLAGHDALEQRYCALVNQLREAVFQTDRNGRLAFVNTAWTRITGQDAKECLGRPLLDFIAEPGREGIELLLREWPQQDYTAELGLALCPGEACWVEIQAHVLREQGEPIGLIGSLDDVTERRQAQERLAHLAHHDALTGLPNRVLFADRLAQALIEAERHGRYVAVALADLDNFKDVNDSLGHLAGDRLLQAVAQRLEGTIRHGDTIARLAGDEFVFLLADMAHADDAAQVAGKILKALELPFLDEGREFFIGASLGLAIYPGDGSAPEELLRHADIAMYRAKERGKAGIQFYTSEMTAKTAARRELEHELRHALERDEFLLHYQPVVEAGTGRIMGAEALLRWQNPGRGLVMPGEFIPVAEESGLIVPIGRWVLETACAQARAWREQGHDLCVSVNLSARQFLENHLSETVSEVLENSGLPAGYLKLEITETMLMRHTEDVIVNLLALRRLGVEIAIDDFGTHYSSFGYLKRFRADHLKIDRSFIEGVAAGSDDATIVHAMISMAHALGMRVVAEGVECAEQAARLRAQGCDQLQGYYFGKPQTAEALDAFLRPGASACGSATG